MLIRVIFIVVLLNLLPFPDSKSQNPGYKGRNFSITLENFLSSSVEFPNVNGQSGLLSLNNRHGIKIGYTLSKNVGINLTYDFYPTKVELVEEVPERFNAPNFQDGMADLTGQNLGLNLRFSYKTISPLGPYIEVGPVFFNYNLSYDRSNFRYRDANNETGYLVPEKESYDFSDWGVGIAYGNQRVLFDYVTLDYALEMNLNFAEGFIGEGYCCGDRVRAESPAEAIKLKSANRVQAHQLISLRLAIGYLPF